MTLRDAIEHLRVVVLERELDSLDEAWGIARPILDDEAEKEQGQCP